MALIALDQQAPAAARTFVAECLWRAVVASALENAQLLVSELVTNSLRHSDAPIREVAVSVELMPDRFRLGVQDSGSNAVISPQPANLGAGAGFGLNLVHMLSDRWGVERPDGGTRVWTELPRTQATGTDSSGRLAIRAA